jgi:DNA uptake protein ComE-like DNA-binding protein
MKSLAISALTGVALLSVVATSASAQLGRQQGLVEPNVAPDSVMLAVPLMTAPIVEALKGARPILSATTFDSIVAAQSLTKAQRTDLYGRMFVHVDLNRGTDAELMLIPGIDAAKLKAIKAGRPWASFEQFQTAMGKVTTPADAARIEQYLFIPIELNTWTDPIMDSFASINVGTPRWKREFAEYRPWTSMEQFDREISKYLRSRPQELKRLARYVYIAK